MASGTIKNNDASYYTLTKGANTTTLNYTCLRNNNVVSIVMNFEGSHTSNDIIATVPSEIRPSSGRQGAGTGILNGVTYPSNFSLNTSGEIKQGLSGQSIAAGVAMFTYIVG